MGLTRLTGSFLDILQDLEEVFQAKNVTLVGSIVGGALVPGAFVSSMSEVNHADGDFGQALWGAAQARLHSILGTRAIWAVWWRVRGLLAFVDDEEGAGVEAVGCLAFDD